VLKYAPRHEDEWRGGGIAPRIFNVDTRWNGLIPREVALGVHWMRGWVNLSAGLDAVAPLSWKG